ncbi:ABC transporter substrate-binding protein [Noviherbaspirillum agri]
MNYLRRMALSLLLSILVLPQAFAQQAESPDELVRRISGEVLAAAKTDPEIQGGNQRRILDLVTEKILPHVDFERMTALAAGRYWRQASPEQQQRLTEEFRDLLVYVYSGALAQVDDDKVIVKPSRGRDRDGLAEVYTEVVQPRGREPIELNYRLAREPSGWKIYDMSILGAWLVQSYRSSFSSQIRNGGIEGLIQTLAERNDRLASKMASRDGAQASGN